MWRSVVNFFYIHINPLERVYQELNITKKLGGAHGKHIFFFLQFSFKKSGQGQVFCCHNAALVASSRGVNFLGGGGGGSRFNRSVAAKADFLHFYLCWEMCSFYFSSGLPLQVTTYSSIHPNPKYVYHSQFLQFIHFYFV